MQERSEMRVVKEDEFDKVDEENKAQAATTELDPLEVLLDVNARQNIVEEVVLTRKGKGPFRVKIQAIQGKVYDEIQDKATTTKQNRRTQQMVKEQDNRMLRRLVVLEGVLEPNLREPRLLEAYGIAKGKEEFIVDAAFLPGEVDVLGDRILTLSGYTDDLIDVTKK